MRSFLFSAFVSPLLFFVACNRSQEYKSPVQYNLGSPSSISIPSEMKNISGISFFKGNASMIYAVDENAGSIYCYYPGSHNVVQSTFEANGPFEDIAIMDSSIYALKNNGTIYAFPMKSMGKPRLDSVRSYTDFFPKGKYEAMFYEDSTRKLVVINKSRQEEKKLTRCYEFHVDSSGIPHKSDEFILYWSTIEKKLRKENITGFHPTALAKNPMTSEWYMISDNEKILVVLDKYWHPSKAYELDPKIFTKPQGMDFDTKGNMYVVNDGTEKTSPNMKVFTYKNVASHIKRTEDKGDEY
ncbi:MULTISPECIES: hypothetical protein [Chitinophagaceae]